MTRSFVLVLLGLASLGIAEVDSARFTVRDESSVAHALRSADSIRSDDCFAGLSDVSKEKLKRFAVLLASIISENKSRTIINADGTYYTRPMNYPAIRDGFAQNLVTLEHSGLIALLSGAELKRRITNESHALIKSCTTVRLLTQNLSDSQLREYVLATIDNDYSKDMHSIPLLQFVEDYSLPETKTDVKAVPYISLVTLAQADESMGAAEGLSEAQKEAVLNYTNEDYKTINRVLRTGQDPSNIRAKVDLIDSAIAASPRLPEGSVLYRGSSHYPQASLRIGDVVTDPAYISTSLSPFAAKVFAGQSGILDIIEIPDSGFSGAYVPRISKKAFEFEVILPRGSRFEIVDVGENVRTDSGSNLSIRKLKLAR